MPVLPIIGIAAAAAGTAVSAVGQASAGANAQSAANYNAQVDVANAKNTLVSGDIAEAQQRYQDRVTLAEGRAAVGASGVTMSGSPMDVMAQNAREAELNALNIRRNARLTAQSQLMGAQASILSGQAAKSASNFNIASTLLTGATKVATGVIGLKGTNGAPVPLVQPNAAGGTDLSTSSSQPA
jgi:hypothetical protein